MIILMSLSLKAYHKWNRYVIQAGTYSCTFSGEPLSDLNEIEFTFRTNTTWYYDETDKPLWRKIRGLSNGDYQENSSAHLAYHCINDSLLVIGACCFVNGVSPEENATQQTILDTIDLFGEYSCRIIREEGLYKVYFEDKYWHYPAGEELDWGYRVDPFVDPGFALDHDWMVDLLDMH